MPSRRFAAALPALLLLALAPASAQQVYKWTDANGVNHYSSTPPPQGEYESRNVGMRDPAVAPAAAATPAEDPACKTARENLALLDGDAPLQVDSDGDGTLDKTLDEADRKTQREAAEAALVRCARAAQAPDATEG